MRCKLLIGESKTLKVEIADLSRFLHVKIHMPSLFPILTVEAFLFKYQVSWCFLLLDLK